MGKKLNWLILLAILPMALALGCGEQGKVEQGRVIGFDKAKDAVTFIMDTKHDTANPDYSGAPVTFTLPKDPMERGADPKAGLRMKLDTKTREIVIYDMLTKGMAKITYTLIDQKENVAQEQSPGGWQEVPDRGQREESHHGVFRPAEIAGDLLGARGIPGPAGEYLGGGRRSAHLLQSAGPGREVYEHNQDRHFQEISFRPYRCIPRVASGEHKYKPRAILLFLW